MAQGAGYLSKKKKTSNPSHTNVNPKQKKKIQYQHKKTQSTKFTKKGSKFVDSRYILCVHVFYINI
jgi:hypothetical protein